jgi:hypothetical protein
MVSGIQDPSINAGTAGKQKKARNVMRAFEIRDLIGCF